ncbi:microtubule-associated protein futsch-like [Sphaeramia orbicularis]|uniref:microtubule-associated protein futsch-like n=1 Tax=Sphaeramia orbicularis TaxID=375764 RepID=UPI00117DAB85|nr:microtubule-associated protein futsch-like [Sphaeramia orbicularis]
MSHNYPHRQLPSDPNLRPDMGSYKPADHSHDSPAHDDFYRPAQEPPPSFASSYASSSSTGSSQASHWTMDGALNILNSCGLEPSDLSVLAELPENVLTVESLPHVLKQIKRKRGTVKPYPSPAPLSSSSSFPHSSIHQHAVREDVHPLSSTPFQYSSLDPVSRSPLSSDQVQDWQDHWRNTRTVTTSPFLPSTSRPDPPPSSSSLVVDYGHKPATSEYSATSVAMVPAPQCPTSSVKPALPSLFSQLGPTDYRPAVPSDAYNPKNQADFRPPGPEASTIGKTTKSRWDIESTSVSTGAMPSMKEAQDFHGTTPMAFPYSCSLCDITVLSERVWNKHVNGTGHADGQLNLLQKFPKWDCRMENISRADNHSEKRKDEGKFASQDSEQQPKRQTQVKTIDKGNVVCVNFPIRSVGEPYLRKLTEPFGKIEKITMFPSLGFVELGSADQANDLVKYYSSCPQTVKGQKIEFKISTTFNVQQSSQVVSFWPAPPGKNGQSDLLSICRRFGLPIYSLFLPSVAFVEMKNISEAQKLVDYYSSNELRIDNIVIRVSFSTEYKTFLGNSAAKRCEDETSSSTKRPRSSSRDRDEKLSIKRRQRSKDREEDRRFRRSRSREKSSRDEKKRSRSREKSSRDEKKRSRSREKSSRDEKKRSRSREKSSKDEKKKSTSEEKSSKDEIKKSMSEEKSSKDEKKKSTSEEKSSKDEIKKSTSEEKSSKDEIKKSMSEEKSSKDEKKKSSSEEKSSKNEEKKSASEEKSIHKEKQHISEDNSIKKTSSEDKSKKGNGSISVEKTVAAETKTKNETKAPPPRDSKPEAVEKELTEEGAMSSEEDSDIEGMEVIGEDLMEVSDEEEDAEEVNTDSAKEKRSKVKDEEASGQRKHVKEEEKVHVMKVHEKTTETNIGERDFPFDLNNCITLDEVNEDESEDEGVEVREEEMDSTSRVVYITRLPLSPYTDAEFIKLVKDYGKAERYYVARHRRLGFIQMSSPSEALKAIDGLRNRSPKFHGFTIHVHLSKKYKWLSSGWDILSDEEKEKEETTRSSRRRSTRSNEKNDLDKSKETSRKTQTGETSSKKTEKKEDSANKKSAEKETASKKTEKKEDSDNKKSIEKETTSKKTEKKEDSTNKKSAEKETTSKKTEKEEDSANIKSAEKEKASKKTEKKEDSANKKSAEKETPSKKTEKKDSDNKKSVEKETTPKKTEKKDDSDIKKSAEKEMASKKMENKETENKMCEEKDHSKKTTEKESTSKKTNEKESVSRNPPEKDTTNKKSTEKELSQKSLDEESASRKPPTELISRKSPEKALVSEKESVSEKSTEKQSKSKNPQEEKPANRTCGEQETVSEKPLEEPASTELPTKESMSKKSPEEDSLANVSSEDSGSKTNPDLSTKTTSDKTSECLESKLSSEVSSENKSKQTEQDSAIVNTPEQPTSEQAPEVDERPSNTCQKKKTRGTKRKTTQCKKKAVVPEKKTKIESVDGTDAMETELVVKEEPEDPQTDEDQKPPDCSEVEGSTPIALPGDLQTEQETAEPAEVAAEERKPSKPVGTEFVRPVVGYFCKLCQVIYADEDEAKLQHCSSLEHYNKYQEQTGKDPWTS